MGDEVDSTPRLERRPSFLQRIGFISRSESTNEEQMPPHLKRKKQATDKVVDKIRTVTAGAKQAEDEEILKFGNLLSDKEKMLETYLNVDYDTTFRFMVETNKSVGGMTSAELKARIDKFSEESNLFVERRTSTLNLKKSKSGTAPFNMNIKLVFSEVSLFDRQQTSKRNCTENLLSPVVSQFYLPKEMEKLRCAVVIGPFYLEWNETSLVVPRKCFLKAYELVDEGILLGSCDANEALNRICDIICDFNGKRTYEENGCNCVTFLDEVMEKFKDVINYTLPPCIDQLLRNMRSVGFVNMDVYLTSDNMAVFSDFFDSHTEGKSPGLVVDMNTMTVNFRNHKTLDQFIYLVREKDPYGYEFRDLLPLLRIMDSVFWVRHNIDLEGAYQRSLIQRKYAVGAGFAISSDEVQIQKNIQTADHSVVNVKFILDYAPHEKGCAFDPQFWDNSKDDYLRNKYYDMGRRRENIAL